MHSYHRSSSSSSSSSSILPSICSLQTFIGLAVILCVYITLQNSISLSEKPLPSEHIKTALPSSVLSASRYELEEIPSYENETEEEDEVVGGLAKDFRISWGYGRGKFYEDGDLLTLSLDNTTGSGFESRNKYLFGKIDMRIKLIPENSAGTVTTLYMSSNGSTHDEIDFEFLGNVSGQPYTIHTNIFSQGKGGREQQFYLWFDPTQDFHSYSILWNPYRIIFFVDGIAIREFKNLEDIGVPFPKNQPMKILSSLWNADDWATQGGRVHTDWSKAPFVASFRNFTASACIWSSETGSSSCGPDPQPTDSEDAWLMEELDPKKLEKMKWVQDNYMTYDYCNDDLRFSEGLPKECTHTQS